MKDNRPFLGLRDPKAPIDSGCDNVIASRLYQAMHLALAHRGGDSIDAGLALLKELNEQGFDVVVRLPDSAEDRQATDG